jgi:hypothetical protein
MSDFYRDNTGAARPPAGATHFLTGDLATNDLTGIWDGEYIWRLGPTDALLMNGTTDELQASLDAAKSQGIKHILIPGDDMVFWYFRRRVYTKAKPISKTVASLASLSQYWGLDVNDPRQLLYPGGGWYTLWDATASSIDVWDLAYNVLERARGVDPWY